jgi:hypothetical protein
VDGYAGHEGGATLERLESELGPLPGTYISTARDDGISGIRLYQIPAQYENVEWPGMAGPGIDIICWYERYVIAWPSWHSGVEDIYRWWMQLPDGPIPVEFPDAERLPELPESWCEFLARAGLDQPERIKVGDIRAWVDKYGAGEMCRQMRYTLKRWITAIQDAANVGGIHDMARDGINALVGDRAKGCTGLRTALGKLRTVFLEAMGSRSRSRAGQAREEWLRMLIGAAEKHPKIKNGDECAKLEEAGFIGGDDPGKKARRAQLLAGLRTGAWLDAQEFPPLRYAIPEIIPEGLSLLAGPPKVGKSVLLLRAGIEAARAGQMFGMRLDGHDVFYLALEDSHRRMQKRCDELLEGDRIPGEFNYQLEIKPGKLIDTVAAWLTDFKRGLVLIDTLGRALERPQKGETTYDRDYRIVVALKGIADAHPGSTIIVSHHSRKATADDFVDAVSGTNAIAGGCDTVLVLNRQRSSRDGLLKVAGRDVNEAEYAVMLDRPLGWQLDGDNLLESAGKAANKNSTMGNRMSEMVAFIDSAPGSVDRAMVAEELGITTAEASTYLKRACDAGHITRTERGKYGKVAKIGLARL